MGPASIASIFFFVLSAIPSSAQENTIGDIKNLIVSPVITAYGEALYFAGEYGEEVTKRGLSPKLGVSLDMDAGFFGIIADLSANMDGKYAPDLADIPGGMPFETYFFLEQGGVFSQLGPVNLKAGRFKHYDAVDTPYSLFINSNGISSNILEIGFDDGTFSYESRWIELNHDSHMNTPAWLFNGGYPERGANVKTYSWRLGEMRIGFQDAAVYTGRNFDLEYFLNPIPQYFIQYGKGTVGRPWTTQSDENNIIGLFWTWNQPGYFSLLAQFLMDDFNLHFLLPESTWNPWQAAFSLGGRLETDAGSFGLYIAGATKYTFEPSEMEGVSVNDEQMAVSYGYSYFPETRFDFTGVDGANPTGVIAIEDNMLGYEYGQNNVAVQTDWRGKSADFDMHAALEFRLAGANSPANPWHDLTNDPQDGTHWFDDPVLEKRILAGFSASRDFGDWTVQMKISGGVAFDAMELRAPTTSTGSLADQKIWIWEPLSGNNKLLLSICIGGSYSWKLR